MSAATSRKASPSICANERGSSPRLGTTNIRGCCMEGTSQVLRSRYPLALDQTLPAGDHQQRDEQ